MSQTQKENPTQGATERAEELFHRMGKRFGSLTAFITQRLQRVAHAIQEEAHRLDESPAVSGEHADGSGAGRTGEVYPQATAKAEQLVDQVGQRLSQYTSLAGLQLQKAVARAREEAEDVWAEAQNIRRQNGPKPH